MLIVLMDSKRIFFHFFFWFDVASDIGCRLCALRVVLTVVSVFDFVFYSVVDWTARVRVSLIPSGHGNRLVFWGFRVLFVQ